MLDELCQIDRLGIVNRGERLGAALGPQNRRLLFCLGELDFSFRFSGRIGDRGAAAALGFHLLAHGAGGIAAQGEFLDLQAREFDAPFGGGFLEIPRDAFVERMAFGENLVGKFSRIVHEGLHVKMPWEDFRRDPKWAKTPIVLAGSST